MATNSSWPAVRHAAGLAAMAIVAGVVVAGPAVHSEIDNAYAAGIRVLAGAICGGLAAPMFVVAVWRKPVVRATLSIVLPPLGAAVLTRLSWSDDYSLTHMAVPLSFITVPVTFFVVADRDEPAGDRCPTCGYDLRASLEPRCPECGAIPEVAPSRSTRRWRTVRQTAWLAAAMVVSGLLETFFIRGLLSLG